MKCLDTDLLVGILRRQEGAEKKAGLLDEEGRQATTAVSAFELFYGASKSKRPDEGMKESHKLLSRLLVLPLSLGASEKAASIVGGLEKKGQPLDFRDAMIAGIAIENNLTLVTRNRKDYGRVPGLSIEEW